MAETIRPRAPSWSDLPSERRAPPAAGVRRLAARPPARPARGAAPEPPPCAPPTQRVGQGGRPPSWSDLPSERRARLTVVIGRLAARHLASLAEETAHEPRPCAPTNQRVGQGGRPSS